MSRYDESWLRSLLNKPGYTLPADAPHRRKAPLVEPDLRDGALGAGETKGDNPSRFLVRVTSFRVRLLDEDNLCEKYHVDCCRYAGLIPGDAPGQTEIKTGQRKVKRKDQEHVLIEITAP